MSIKELEKWTELLQYYVSANTRRGQALHPVIAIDALAQYDSIVANWRKFLTDDQPRSARKCTCEP